jgi:ankyrin repeat protein
MTAAHNQDLLKAIKAFDKDAMRAALKAGAFADTPMDDKGTTPLLHFAAGPWHDRIECIQMLLEHGANANHADVNGQTALHRVGCNSAWKSEQVVEILLAHKADLHQPDKFGNTPLHATVRHWLGSNSPFVLLAMLQAGGDVHIKNKAGSSPLDIAVNTRKTPEEKERVTEMFTRYAAKRKAAADAVQQHIQSEQDKLRKLSRQKPGLKLKK